MNFSWIYQTPDKGWWANYRWHLTEPNEKLGLKPNGWKKVFFRKGWQGKILKIEGIDNAKKCLQGLQNGTITAFGGRFRGTGYDRNAEQIIKQAKRSLKEAIKRHEKGENINVEQVAAVLPSYYNWGVIIGISVILIVGIVGLILYLLIFRKKKLTKKF